MRTYTELLTIPTFKERYRYLRSHKDVGDPVFRWYRYLNQDLYSSVEWKSIRRIVIERDNGFDLAFPDCPIPGQVYVHHIEPITIEDILHKRDKVFDPENLVCVSLNTHNAIHYGDETLLPDFSIVERSPNDTIPWR